MTRKDRLWASDRRIIDVIVEYGETSPTAIAKRLGLAWHTVRTHISHIYAVLGIHSMEELKAIYAVPTMRQCSRCKETRPVEDFRRVKDGLSRQCTACYTATLFNRLAGILRAIGPSTVAELSAACGKDRRTVQGSLMHHPELFCVVSKTSGAIKTAQLWALHGQAQPVEEQPVEEQPPSNVITWDHSSPVATWQLSGEVVDHTALHYIVFANGCRFEVPIA